MIMMITSTTDDIPRLPSVMVGNIDPGMGTVTITPEKVYEGQTKVDYTITFEATGPMYDSYIHIRVPQTLGAVSTPTTDREDTDGDPSKGYVRVLGTGSVRLGIGDTDPVSIIEYTVPVGDIESNSMGILIAIEEMDSGEKVVVEYDNVTVGRDAPATPANSQFIVATSTRPVPASSDHDDHFGLNPDAKVYDDRH